MEGLAKWLADISWPLVSKVLGSIGIGVVSYGGISEAFGGVISASQQATVGLLPVVVQLIARAGFFDALSITSGGFTAGLSYLVMKHLALKVGSS